MVLGKLPVPGRPTNLDYGKARAYCSCMRCGWVFVSPAKQKRDICIAFPASSLSSSSAAA